MFICLTKSLLELVPGSLTDVVVGTYPSLSFASSPGVTSKLCLALPSVLPRRLDRLHVSSQADSPC
jgi:hypothetical protein